MAGCTRYGLNLATQAALKGNHGSQFFPSPAEFKALYDAAMKPVHAQMEAQRRQERRDSDSEEARRIDRQRNPSRSAADIARDLAAKHGLAEHLLADTPMGRRLNRLRTENAGKIVLASGVSMADFARRAAKHEFGEGARYVPMLETIYER